jgi:hypothetical protein
VTSERLLREDKGLSGRKLLVKFRGGTGTGIEKRKRSKWSGCTQEEVFADLVFTGNAIEIWSAALVSVFRVKFIADE